MTRAFTIWLMLLLPCWLGCSHKEPSTPGPLPKQPASAGKLWVGTGRADLTMPPGPATFGHGPDSRVADGYWTRTYCRVFYFKPEHGEPLALVPCELPAMSLLLQRRVAEKLSEKKVALHASRLMMTATHTHAGVGHYFGAAQYTGIFSSRLPGYDQSISIDLAERIAAAIAHAAGHTERAQLSWRHRDDFWCFTRNRSLQAYQLNHPPFAPTPPSCTQGFPELAAVDPAFDLLRIDRYDELNPAASPVPIGSIAFFAMHPTVVHSSNQLFGGDAFGVISRQIEGVLRREQCRAGAGCDGSRDPLHALINTNEGDISPLWREGDIDEAIRVGKAVATFVAESHDRSKFQPAQPQPLIEARYIEEDITKARFVEDGQTLQNCCYPEVGLGAARGGTDHRTSVAALSWFGSDPVIDYQATRCQAPKLPLLGPVSLLTHAKGAFPWVLPFATANLAGTMVAFVPAELTITAGHRLKKRMLAELAEFGGAPRRVVVAGLANEYIQYIATEEEYQYQDYEGASTLFGPNSSRYFSNRIGLLARSMFDPATQHALEKAGLRDGQTHDIDYGYGPETETRFGSGMEFQRQHLGTCVMPDTVTSLEPPRICVYWRDGGPTDVALAEPLAQPPWLSLVVDAMPRQRARVCLADGLGTCDPGAVVDDRGLELRTRIHDRVGKSWVWSSLFSPSAETWHELKQRSVRIHVHGRPPVESQAFGNGCMPARCTARQARLCLSGVRTDDWAGLVAKD